MRVQAEDGGESVRAHKIVLCLRSPYLRRLLAGKPAKVAVTVEGIAETAVLHEVSVALLLWRSISRHCLP